jgi:nicotinamide-nucleotide adenylyltransferase
MLPINMGTALFIGRFQPFHIGHLRIIEQILKKNDDLSIVVGSSQESKTPNNPLSYRERRRMILLALSEIKINPDRIKTLPLKDYKTHDRWINRLLAISGNIDIVYVGDNILLAHRLREKGIDVRYNKNRYYRLDSANIRKMILAGIDWKQYVPSSVYSYLQRIEFPGRLKELNMNN